MYFSNNHFDLVLFWVFLSRSSTSPHFSRQTPNNSIIFPLTFLLGHHKTCRLPPPTPPTAFDRMLWLFQISFSTGRKNQTDLLLHLLPRSGSDRSPLPPVRPPRDRFILQSSNPNPKVSFFTRIISNFSQSIPILNPVLFDFRFMIFEIYFRNFIKNSKLGLHWKAIVKSLCLI